VQLGEGVEGDENQVKMPLERELADIHLVQISGQSGPLGFLAQDLQHIRGSIDAGQADARFEQGERDRSLTLIPGFPTYPRASWRKKGMSSSERT
jgi:hypothetical protein